MKRSLVIVILLAGCSSSDLPVLRDLPRDDGGFVIDSTGHDSPPVPVPPAQASSKRELRLEIVPRLRHQIVVFTAEELHGGGWCAPCLRLKSSWKAGNDQIHIEWSSKPVSAGPEIYPAIRWRDGSGTERYPTDVEGRYRVPNSLDELLQIIERNQPPDKVAAADKNSAGTLHGRGQVVSALDWIRANIGENVRMMWQWDRTGAQTFPLLRGRDCSAIALLGRSGHLGLSAPGCKLPVDHVGFGYQVSGDDLVLDPDPVTLHGLALRLLPRNGSPVTGGRQVSMVDPLTLWTIFSVLNSVWGMLHPQADLTLGGNVSATAVLKGDMLAIDFQQMPAIRLVLLFTFHLSVRRLEVTPDTCRILFEGSRLIRERTVNVSD